MTINEKINNRVAQKALTKASSANSVISTQTTMADLIIAEAEYKFKELNQAITPSLTNGYKKTGLLIVRTANQCLEEASKQPIPKMLCGSLWHEGELSILFADTNVGKSIAAVQVADRISRGQSDKVLPMEAHKQKVIYADFELTDKQFENRYTFNFTNPYHFDDNFLRVGLNSGIEIPSEYKGFDDYLIANLEAVIKETEAKVVIIDNLTFLRAENEQAKEAGSLMILLKNLKENYGLSMLILAHTPKRPMHKPLDVNDLQGSKMISNFSDSIWAIGTSQKGTNIRYIKQIKERATAKQYGEDNVIVCQIEKDSNFLCFTHTGYGREWEHLKIATDLDRQERDQEIKSLKDQGLNNIVLGKRFGLTEGAIRKILKAE